MRQAERAARKGWLAGWLAGGKVEVMRERGGEDKRAECGGLSRGGRLRLTQKFRLSLGPQFSRCPWDDERTIRAGDRFGRASESVSRLFLRRSCVRRVRVRAGC